MHFLIISIFTRTLTFWSSNVANLQWPMSFFVVDNKGIQNLAFDLGYLSNLSTLESEGQLVGHSVQGQFKALRHDDFININVCENQMKHNLRGICNPIVRIVSMNACIFNFCDMKQIQYLSLLWCCHDRFSSLVYPIPKFLHLANSVNSQS